MLRPLLYNTLIVLRAVLTLALMAGVLWTWKAVAGHWPEKGLYAFFVVLMPVCLALTYYLQRDHGLKHTNYWNEPVPTSIDYDIDLTPNTLKARLWRAYLALGVVVACGLWLYSLWIVVR